MNIIKKFLFFHMKQFLGIFQDNTEVFLTKQRKTDSMYLFAQLTLCLLKALISQLRIIHPDSKRDKVAWHKNKPLQVFPKKESKETNQCLKIVHLFWLLMWNENWHGKRVDISKKKKKKGCQVKHNAVILTQSIFPFKAFLAQSSVEKKVQSLESVLLIAR